MLMPLKFGIDEKRFFYVIEGKLDKLRFWPNVGYNYVNGIINDWKKT